MLITVVMISVAIVCFIVATLCLGGIFHFEKKHSAYFLPISIGLIHFSVFFKNLLTKRDVTAYVNNPGGYYVEQGGIIGLFLKGVTGLLFVMALVCIVGYFLRKSHKKLELHLFFSFILMFLSGYVLNAAFGTVPSFNINVVVAFFVFLLPFFCVEASLKDVVFFAKSVALTSLILGLCAAIVFPDMAIQRNFHGWIPGVYFRLWGVDNHANTLGPLAAIFCLLEAWMPFERKSLHRIALIAGALSLVLAQSKTSWVAMMVALIALYGGRYCVSFVKGFSSDKLPLSLVLVLVVPLIVCVAAFSIYATFNQDFLFTKLMVSKEGGQLLTLTGRDVIWDISLREWERNFFFGYGPLLWNPQFSNAYNLLGVASNAHNQFVDVLSSAGMVGLLGFVLFFTMLFVYSLKAFTATNGYSLAIFFFLVARSISEVPFKLGVLVSNDTFIQLILISVVVIVARGKSELLADCDGPKEKRMMLGSAV